MAIEFTVFPDIPKTTQTVSIEGIQYQLTLTWIERTQGWYMDLRLLDGTDVALGQRLSPGWGPLFHLLPENAPPGVFLVSGPDPYNQDTLGQRLFLRYYEESEIPEETSTAGLTVS